MQVKAARRKKHLCIILNIQQNLNFPARTENQAFVFIFVRKKTEFLSVNHWLSWLPEMLFLKREKGTNFAVCWEL